MRTDLLLGVLAIVSGGVGTWLMLPHRHGNATPRRVHATGALLAAIGALLLATQWVVPGRSGTAFDPDPLLAGLFFYAFALIAIVAAVLMITARSPVHSALWFAAVVLATSGLFLLEGAQFLAAGTVIVYAGAIIVTFLFVIMLAQTGGQASYDRAARSPAMATLTCFLVLWAVLYSLATVRRPLDAAAALADPVDRLTPTARLPFRPEFGRSLPVAQVIDAAVPGTSRFPEAKARPAGTPPPHVAGLGGTLYTDHLIAAEVAGVILFVALVGAAAIATPKAPVRPDPTRRAATADPS
jgi:NADH-quinone oxidoreductase subunit J